jgi:hypothetical protein
VTTPAFTTDSSTLTEGFYCSLAAICWRGYASGSYGSLSSTSLSGGGTVTGVVDHQVGSLYQGELSGTFATNPGATWLTSVTAKGVTLKGSTATFSYSSGTASWIWPLAATGTSFGFKGSGSDAVAINHR